MKKNLYPAFLDISRKRAVVVGGGAVAQRKVMSLLAAGADVAVVSPELAPELASLARDGRITHLPRRYGRGDLDDASLVFAATDSGDVNREVASDAKAAGVPVNCASPPDAGDFIVPSSIHQAGITLAISTGGGCPALTKKLRADFEGFLGGGYGGFLEFLEQARRELKTAVPEERLRRELLGRLVESGLAEVFRDRPSGEASIEAARVLEKLMSDTDGAR